MCVPLLLPLRSYDDDDDVTIQRVALLKAYHLPKLSCYRVVPPTPMLRFSLSELPLSHIEGVSCVFDYSPYLSYTETPGYSDTRWRGVVVHFVVHGKEGKVYWQATHSSLVERVVSQLLSATTLTHTYLSTFCIRFLQREMMQT